MLYAGIGSRGVPDPVAGVMAQLGHVYAGRGHILRGGGAGGSDTAFESGCDANNGAKEIILPWQGFNGRRSPLYLTEELEARIKRHRAFDVIRLACGAVPFEARQRGDQKLILRDVLEMLGMSLRRPVHRVICWTHDGRATGGTRFALFIAQSYNIEVLNLHDPATYEQALDYLSARL